MAPLALRLWGWAGTAPPALLAPACRRQVMDFPASTTAEQSLLVDLFLCVCIPIPYWFCVSGEPCSRAREKISALAMRCLPDTQPHCRSSKAALDKA